MKYEGFTTFRVKIEGGICTVTFDFPPVNVQGLPMLADLSMLAQKLEADKSVKVVVFDSANPDIWVCHADTEFLKDMSGKPVSRDEAKLSDLQAVLERISHLPQATIAKIEGFARGGGHEFALACDMRFAVRGKAKFMQMEVCERHVIADCFTIITCLISRLAVLSLHRSVWAFFPGKYKRKLCCRALWGYDSHPHSAPLL